MSSNTRAEVSKKNPFWLEKHRYYELKHFCMQYKWWVKQYAELDILTSPAYDYIPKSKYENGNPTERVAFAKLYYSEKMDLIHKAIALTDPSGSLSNYIFIGATEGCSYDRIKVRMWIPQTKEEYYNALRKFFWILHHIKGD